MSRYTSKTSIAAVFAAMLLGMFTAAYQPPGLRAQSLASPTFTIAQATRGKEAYAQSCASCHTLAAAHATGAVGPNLDQLKPSEAIVASKVTNGGGGMPAFGGRLSSAQIDAIAAYVARSTRR